MVPRLKVYTRILNVNAGVARPGRRKKIHRGKRTGRAHDPRMKRGKGKVRLVGRRRRRYGRF